MENTTAMENMKTGTVVGSPPAEATDGTEPEALQLPEAKQQSTISKAISGASRRLKRFSKEVMQNDAPPAFMD